MRVRFKSTTNRAFDELKGIDGELHIGLKFSFDFNDTTVKDFMPSFDLRHGTMSSSTIKSITYNETARFFYEITIETRNTTYMFTSGTPSEQKPLTDKEILSLQMMTLV
jgi:hypothetical protein